MVPCIDEKAQIRALNRTRPVLPMSFGVTERRSHDYLHHDATSLFAALDWPLARSAASFTVVIVAWRFAVLSTIEDSVPKRRFALLTEGQIKRGCHRCTFELEQAVRDYLKTCNKNLQSFVWHKMNHTNSDGLLHTKKHYATI